MRTAGGAVGSARRAVGRTRAGVPQLLCCHPSARRATAAKRRAQRKCSPMAISACCRTVRLPF
eukprot:1200485-Prymnesium_polylepis.2